MVKKIKHNNQNKILYAFIILGILIVLTISAYALVPGVAPNPGHVITQVAPPSPCVTGQFIKWTGSTWVCADGTGGTPLPLPPTPTLFTYGGCSLVSVSCLYDDVARSPGSVELTWYATTDAAGVIPGVAGYNIYRDNVKVGSVLYSSYSVIATWPPYVGVPVFFFTDSFASDPDNERIFNYSITAYNANGQESSKSYPVKRYFIPADDTTPPTISITSPESVYAIEYSNTNIVTHVTDNVGIGYVLFFVDGIPVGYSLSSDLTENMRTEDITFSLAAPAMIREGIHWISAIAYDKYLNPSEPTPPVLISVPDGVSWCGDGICQIGEDYTTCPKEPDPYNLGHWLGDCNMGTFGGGGDSFTGVSDYMGWSISDSATTFNGLFIGDYNYDNSVFSYETLPGVSDITYNYIITIAIPNIYFPDESFDTAREDFFSWAAGSASWMSGGESRSCNFNDQTTNSEWGSLAHGCKFGICVQSIAIMDSYGASRSALGYCAES